MNSEAGRITTFERQDGADESRREQIWRSRAHLLNSDMRRSPKCTRAAIALLPAGAAYGLALETDSRLYEPGQAIRILGDVRVLLPTAP